MDISNFLIIAIPSATTLFSCGVKLKEENTNYFIRYTYSLLFCFLAVILSFLSVFADIPEITINETKIGGIELAICFFLLMAVLLFAFWTSVHQIEDLITRKVISILIFFVGLLISFITVFINQLI
ncbi:hypothetical protein ACFLTI_08535 [Bacteroidota bacterium]